MSRGIRRNSPGIRRLTLWLIVLAPLAGCTRSGEIVLEQPSAPPQQQYLRLASAWAFRAIDGDRQKCLLAFPLPGAMDGPRDFLVYFTAPTGTGELTIDADRPDATHGFLIQKVGDLRGRTDFAGGSLHCQEVWLAPRFRQMDLNVHCADGTVIRGRALVEDLPAEVRMFEREYAGDVQTLAPESQPTEGQRTGTRNVPAR